MTTDQIIETPAPSDLPTFTILVEGEEVPQEMHVESVVITKIAGKISSARIIILDGDPSTQDFAASDSEIFIPTNTIVINSGYHSNEDELFSGVIVRNMIKTRLSRPSQLIVDCRHSAVKLTIGRKNACFEDMTDSDAISEIFDSYGINASVDPTSVTHHCLVQCNSTDWDFVVSRADACGLLVLTNQEEVKVVKPDFSSSPVLTALFGSSIREADLEMDARTQVPVIKGETWNYADQEVISIESQDPDVKSPGNIMSGDLAKAASPEEYSLVHSGAITEEELQAWIDAAAVRRAMAKITGRISCTGTLAVNPGDLIDLGGIGDRFSGTAFVSGVRHTLGKGAWITDIQVGHTAEWFAEEYEITQIPASALLPATIGMHIGKVTALAGDPDGEFRVRVKLPTIDPEAEGVWARVSCLDAGAERGVFIRPEIDDEVVLGFLNDDPRQPVILGMLNSSAKAAPLESSDDNHEKGYVSRSKMEVIFNDDEKSITVKTPGERQIAMSDDGSTIEIKDSSSSITIDDSGITMESGSDITIKATGNITIEGTEIKLSASANLKAEGSAGAEISSGASTVVKGSIVQIN